MGRGNIGSSRSVTKIWPRWGLGTAEDVPHPDARYPTAQAQQFYASWPARLGGGNALNEANLIALLERTGPAVLISHSASGPMVFSVAQDRPDLVRALVMIEPTGCPTDPADLWPDPQRFDVERFMGARPPATHFIPYGGGARR